MGLRRKAAPAAQSWFLEFWNSSVVVFPKLKLSPPQLFSSRLLADCTVACSQISTADRTHARTGPDTQRAQAHNHTDTQNSNPRSAPQTNLTFTRTHTPPASLLACLDRQSVSHTFISRSRPAAAAVTPPRTAPAVACGAGSIHHRRPDVRRLSRRVSPAPLGSATPGPPVEKKAPTVCYIRVRIPLYPSEIYRTGLPGCETGGCNHPFSHATVENLSELNSTYRHISGRG